MPTGRHELLCRGARVVVDESGVHVLTDPAVRSCPYVEATFKIKRIDKDAVKKIIEWKIERYGHFCPHRTLSSDLLVPFGSSEMISSVMNRLVDCAVVVCDGAGSVIVWNPELVQGIGAAMTGLLSTTPIPEVIARIREMGGEVLEDPRIDQAEAVRKAIEMGFRRIAVTVVGPNAKEIGELREIEKRERVKLAVFSTCNTLVPEEYFPYLEMADVVCASASRRVIERIGPMAIMQMGIHIPVFVLTKLGKEIALEYLKVVKSPIVVSRARMPFVIEDKLPELG